MDRSDIYRRLEEQKLALDQSAIVAQTDERGVINYVNDKFCEISMYSRDEVIGKTHSILNSGYHPSSFFAEMWSTIGRGEIWRGEICNRKRNGDLYWVGTTIVPYLDSVGRPRQYLAIRQDITALKQAQEKIMSQQAQLVANSRLSTIGEMSAAITHEINNPLGVVLGRCEMLRTLLQNPTVPHERINTLVEAIELNARRIEKIVRSMRTLAHQGADEPFQKVLAQEVLDDALDLTAERVKNHGISLRVQSPVPNLTIECRRHEILQILVNLINNAFDAVQTLPEKWISIEFNDEGEDLQVRVMDSGSGISESVAQHIFEPFFSTKKVQYGTGLGLAISRSLAAKHQGALTLDRSRLNTCFCLSLPKLQIKS